MKANGTLKSNLERCRHDRPAGPLTRSQLAHRLGVNRSYITLLEKGQRKPSASLLFKMSKVLGLPVTDLYQYFPPDQDST